jgi:hypothetical protein
MYFNCEVKIPEEAGKITLNKRGCQDVRGIRRSDRKE